MNPLQILKAYAKAQVASIAMPSSLERGILSDKIAGRIVPMGSKIVLDHDAAERFARSCVDETIAHLQKKIAEERDPK